MLVGDAVTFRNDGEAVVHQDLTCSLTFFSCKHKTILFKSWLVNLDFNALNGVSDCSIRTEITRI